MIFEEFHKALRLLATVDMQELVDRGPCAWATFQRGTRSALTRLAGFFAQMTILLMRCGTLCNGTSGAVR